MGIQRYKQIAEVSFSLKTFAKVMNLSISFNGLMRHSKQETQPRAA